MGNLFRAALRRLLWLKKCRAFSRAFYVSVAGVLLFELLLLGNAYGDYADQGIVYLTPFAGVPAMLFSSAVFVGFFVGAEYSEGTLRNKVIAGYRRSEIYLSNLAACYVGNAMVLTATLLFSLGVSCVFAARCEGPPVWVVCHKSGLDGQDALWLAFCVLCAYLAVLAITAVMVALAMANARAMVNTVVSIVLAVMLWLGAMWLVNALQATPTYEDYTEMPPYVDYYALSAEEQAAYDELVESLIVEVPNPDYLQGQRLERTRWAADLLPGGQAVQLQLSASLADRENTIRLHWPLDSLAVTLLVTGIGLAVFHKKDLL